MGMGPRVTTMSLRLSLDVLTWGNDGGTHCHAMRSLVTNPLVGCEVGWCDVQTQAEAAWMLILALPPTSCATLSNLLSLSGPRFPLL